jgi:limonene-1,2-epoxide hydrolase
MATPEDVVREFCAAVSKRDADLIRPLLADDVVYHNIGMAPSVGIEATIANLQGQWSMFTGIYEFRVSNLAAAGDVVLTERIDEVGGDGSSMAVPVMGVFELRDGRIARWRDYFDTGLLAKMGAGEDVSALVP